MTGQSGDITWHDHRTPVSTRFDDPYFSMSDGLSEARHVFLNGNNLPARFTPGFHIAELGFGTGLNMLAAWQAYLETGLSGALRFTSFEAFPLPRADMETALSGFSELADLRADFLSRWPSADHMVSLPGLDFTLVPGDARQQLPKWNGAADAWFLDGFSPAKNPELWGEGLLAQVAKHTTPKGTFATYSAAGHIRRALSSAGFCVRRIPGYGHKRHMSIGQIGQEQ